MGEPTTIQLLDALLDIAPSAASREHLVHKAGVSTASFYRTMKPLIHDGLVEENEGRYTLPFSNFHNYRYKLWRDSHRLYRLPSLIRDYILDLRLRVLQDQGSNLLALWLVGSAAQDQMHDQSDLDLLAVLETEPEIYHPLGQFEMNFVTMDRPLFEEKFREREGFVLTALRYGLLLHDNNFARPYLTESVSSEIDVSRFYRDEEVLDYLKDRIFSFLKLKDELEVRKSLSSYAVNLGRLILRLYGVLPAGKSDLLKAIRNFVGEDFANALSESIKSTESADPVRLYRRLDDYRYFFHENASHLKRYSSLPIAAGVELEALCNQLFAELTKDQKIKDLFDFEHGPLQIGTKSLTRNLTKAQLKQMAAKPDKTWIVNIYRDIPLLERPDLHPSIRKLARTHSLRLVTAPELLRFYTRWRLQENISKEDVSRFLQP